MGSAEIVYISEGYAGKLGKGWRANASQCLIKSDNKYILCDPGCNREVLDSNLRNNNINYEDIDVVFLSHNHLDHILLAGLFARADVISYENYRYNNDNLYGIDNELICKDVRRIYTPGHCQDHYSLLINTRDCVICFAGDVFWCEDNDNISIDIDTKDPLVDDTLLLDSLMKSRRYLLNNSDIIIPGHGKVFCTKKSPVREA